MEDLVAMKDLRIKFYIVPMKSDPSKIFIIAKADHCTMDGLSLLKTLANM